MFFFNLTIEVLFYEKKVAQGLYYDDRIADFQSKEAEKFTSCKSLNETIAASSKNLSL